MFRLKKFNSFYWHIETSLTAWIYDRRQYGCWRGAYMDVFTAYRESKQLMVSRLPQKITKNQNV